ncbi:Mast cell protease 8 [Oryzias melastigma]|uniref:trypsin n=1 Tax=Oryzias melastigma TaxID=30732 RepID=A0A3B3DLA7_ORYME|nr:mast cell protease 8 [Oryzias melastigma]KAF6718765.1 Mast cell protease 8 [Oryzias melastigma]
MSFLGQLAVVTVVLAFYGQANGGKIIGGHVAKPHSRPYMALLKRNASQNQVLFCDGFLLNEDFVMTAAHCQAEFITVLLGLHNVNDKVNVQEIPVKEAFPSKHYNTKGFVNDLMILKLSSKAQINDYVKPIALADHSSPVPQHCVVSGWGKTSMNDAFLSRNLMEVEVTLIRGENCPNEQSFCSEGQAGPAPGDSGSPLVCEGDVAYGVVSTLFSPPSGGKKLYVFAKISDQKQWITSAMEKSLIKN